MTEIITDPSPTPAANPATPAEPITAPITAPVENDPPSAFSLPEEYANEGWAKNIKSEEDAWKMLKSSQELVGKKTIPFDYTRATPEQIEQHRASTRPEKIEAYDIFPENANPQSKEFAQKMFHELAIDPFVAKQLVTKMDEQQKAVLEASTDPESFKTLLKDSFGNDFEKVSGESVNFLKKNMNEKDTAMLDALPNDQLALLYRLANNVQKTYGANESSAALGGGEGGVGAVDMVSKRAEIRQQINDLSKRPHESSEKDNLLNQLKATYK